MRVLTESGEGRSLRFGGRLGLAADRAGARLAIAALAGARQLLPSYARMRIFLNKKSKAP